MPERFMRGIEALNGIVWGPMGLGLLFGTGLLLTVRTGASSCGGGATGCGTPSVPS